MSEEHERFFSLVGGPRDGELRRDTFNGTAVTILGVVDQRGMQHAYRIDRENKRYVYVGPMEEPDGSDV